MHTFLKNKMAAYWQIELADLFNDKKTLALSQFLEEAYEQGIIYPEEKLIFRAFETLKLTDIKVVIIGQDPYHGMGEANGLCFSVNKGIKVPPSLKNIYKELVGNFNNYQIPNHGDLDFWNKQGVLLLNSILTVEKDKAGSHRKKGWEYFTDFTINYIAKNAEHVVFMLWGNYAISKLALIAGNQSHLILTAPHPSPLGAHNGWFGNNHFLKANDFLKQNFKQTIDWQIPVAQKSLF